MTSKVLTYMEYKSSKSDKVYITFICRDRYFIAYGKRATIDNPDPYLNIQSFGEGKIKKMLLELKVREKINKGYKTVYSDLPFDECDIINDHYYNFSETVPDKIMMSLLIN